MAGRSGSCRLSEGCLGTAMVGGFLGVLHRQMDSPHIIHDFGRKYGR